MEIIEYVESTEAKQGFYPTPPNVLEVLLSNLKGERPKHYQNILEPSCGKGDIVYGIMEIEAKRAINSYGDYRGVPLNFDVIEIDSNLRGVLDYKFGGKYVKEERDKIKTKEAERLAMRKADNEKTQDYLDEQQRLSDVISEMEKTLTPYRASKVRVVHDDFMTFQTSKIYDLIVMNPPFKTGVDHVLKAIEMQTRCGGDVWAVLNANSLTNAYSNKRELLLKLIEEYEGEVQYIANGFSDSERKTDVQVAVIKISIPKVDPTSDIYETLNKAKEEKFNDEFEQCEELADKNFIKSILLQYNMEIEASAKLIKEYFGLQQFLSKELGEFRGCILHMTIQGEQQSSTTGQYASLLNTAIIQIRSKYWKGMFSSPQFMGRMPSSVKNKYMDMIDTLKDYDFTEFNINKLSMEMVSSFRFSVDDTIMDLFEDLTKTYSYHSDIANKNRHLFNGWKTNQAHKVGKKVIQPVNMFSQYYYGSGSFDFRKASSFLEDLERALNYITGTNESVNLYDTMKEYSENGVTKNIQLKYFSVTFYKKGTIHIAFTDLELLDRFNIYCCGRKGWLPPSYGKKTYEDLSEEEKDVVDTFHNDDGKAKDVKGKYDNIVANNKYYLANLAENSAIKLLE